VWPHCKEKGKWPKIAACISIKVGFKCAKKIAGCLVGMSEPNTNWEDAAVAILLETRAQSNEVENLLRIKEGKESANEENLDLAIKFVNKEFAVNGIFEKLIECVTKKAPSCVKTVKEVWPHCKEKGKWPKIAACISIKVGFKCAKKIAGCLVGMPEPTTNWEDAAVAGLLQTRAGTVETGNLLGIEEEEELGEEENWDPAVDLDATVQVAMVKVVARRDRQEQQQQQQRRELQKLWAKIGKIIYNEFEENEAPTETHGQEL